MKYLYTYEGQPVSIGSRVGEYTIRDLSEGLVRVTSPLPSGACYAGYSDWAYADKLGITALKIPEKGLFNRITGERLSSADNTVLPNGSTIYWFEDYSKRLELCVLSADRNSLVVNRSEELLELGVELRTDMSPALMTGLPRTTRKDGAICVKVGRFLVPAEDAVWCHAEGKYLRRDKAVPVSGTWYPEGHADLIQFIDGSFGKRGDGFAITGGPHAGKFVRSRRDRAMVDGGKWHPVSELTPIWHTDGSSPYEYLLEPPTNNPTYELVEGEWSLTGLAVTTLSGDRAPRHRAMQIRSGYYSRTGHEYSWIRAHELDEVATYCSECGYWYLNHLVENGECHRCSGSSRTRIRNYSNDTATGMKPEEDVALKFGIELEVGTDKGYDTDDCARVMADALSDKDDFAKYGVFKHDGSIECGGFEVVTRPDSPAVHKRIWTSALNDPEVTRHMSSWSNGYCGMHIHVSRKPLSALWIGRILVTVNSPDMSRIVSSVAGRKGSRYAVFQDKRLTSGKSQYGDRYEAVNTSGSNTIEFRIFRGTLDPGGFVRNIEFVEAVLAFTRPATTSLTSIGNAATFLDFVSKSRKTYPVLFDFLVAKEFISDARRKTTV
jgi:hypothetical protein